MVKYVHLSAFLLVCCATVCLSNPLLGLDGLIPAPDYQCDGRFLAVAGNVYIFESIHVDLVAQINLLQFDIKCLLNEPIYVLLLAKIGEKQFQIEAVVKLSEVLKLNLNDLLKITEHNIIEAKYPLYLGLYLNASGSTHAPLPFFQSLPEPLKTIASQPITVRALVDIPFKDLKPEVILEVTQSALTIAGIYIKDGIKICLLSILNLNNCFDILDLANSLKGLLPALPAP